MSSGDRVGLRLARVPTLGWAGGMLLASVVWHPIEAPAEQVEPSNPMFVSENSDNWLEASVGGLEDLNRDGQIVILCFGDSITRGVGDGPSATDTPPGPAGYPPRLQALTGVTVLDDGIPGERTDAGLARLQNDLEEARADYVILLEGTNDVEDRRTESALDNIASMIGASFAAGSLPILGTITPSCCNHRNMLPREAIVSYNEGLRRLAADEGLSLIDFYQAFVGSSDGEYHPEEGLIHVPEGLHPTPTGYTVMATVARLAFFPVSVRVH